MALGAALGALRQRNPIAVVLFSSAAVALGLVPLFWTRGRSRWAHRIDALGVTRRDGRVFPWTSFVRVEVARGRAGVFHYDLVFADAEVRLPLAFAQPQDEIGRLAASLQERIAPSPDGEIRTRRPVDESDRTQGPR